jgi:hypothetical protein
MFTEKVAKSAKRTLNIRSKGVPGGAEALAMPAAVPGRTPAGSDQAAVHPSRRSINVPV